MGHSARMSYRTQNSEIYQVARVFFRLGRYMFIMGSFVGVGWWMFGRFTMSPEEVRQKYMDADPVSRQPYKDSIERQNEMRREVFRRAGIIPQEEEQTEQ